MTLFHKENEETRKSAVKVCLKDSASVANEPETSRDRDSRKDYLYLLLFFFFFHTYITLVKGECNDPFRRILFIMDSRYGKRRLYSLLH